MARRETSAVGLAETRSGMLLAKATGVSAASAAVLSALPPLPFAARELEALVHRRFARSVTRTDAEAGEPWFKTAADVATADVILIASHSIAPDPDDPRSEPGLALSGEADGLLRQSEVATLTLSARLVILSACDTSQPAPADDDPASGFARSFFAAGSRAVMVSHWPVADNAQAGLMARVFARWPHDRAATVDPAVLLRGAMRAMKASGDPLLSSPRSWAGMAIVEP